MRHAKNLFILQRDGGNVNPKRSIHEEIDLESKVDGFDMKLERQLSNLLDINDFSSWLLGTAKHVQIWWKGSFFRLSSYSSPLLQIPAILDSGCHFYAMSGRTRRLAILEVKGRNDFPFPHQNLDATENRRQLECNVDPNNVFVVTTHPILVSEMMG